MKFANPLYFLLLILIIPIIVWYVIRLQKVQASFKLSSSNAIKRLKPTLKIRLRHLPFVLRLFAIILLIIALARPQSISSSDVTDSKGIDIVMALDLSGTMMAQDFHPNRLEAAKKVAAEFINDRIHDRIGLVTFASESFTQCPLTVDHKVLLNVLNKIKYGEIEDGTAIGLGLANAVNRLKDSPSKSRVIILITDGSNNAGIITPKTAASLAIEYGIKVYTIGVGSRGTAKIVVDGPYGPVVQNVPVDIDENTLQDIASITHGKYFRATDNSSLKQIYNAIDKMEKYHVSVNTVTKRKELYVPFILWAFILVGVDLIIRRTWLRIIP